MQTELQLVKRLHSHRVGTIWPRLPVGKLADKLFDRCSCLGRESKLHVLHSAILLLFDREMNDIHYIVLDK